MKSAHLGESGTAAIGVKNKANGLREVSFKKGGKLRHLTGMSKIAFLDRHPRSSRVVTRQQVRLSTHNSHEAGCGLDAGP